jgi:hypothetical protein
VRFLKEEITSCSTLKPSFPQPTSFCEMNDKCLEGRKYRNTQL